VLLALACGLGAGPMMTSLGKPMIQWCLYVASNTNRTVEWEDEGRMTDDRSLVSSLNARHSDGAGPSPRPHLSSDLSRAPPLLLAERYSRGGRNFLSSPATSMAEFYHDGKSGNTGRGMTFFAPLQTAGIGH